jgi:hypothetical protein
LAGGHLASNRRRKALSGNGSWFSIKILGMDRTENGASNSYSIVSLCSRYLAIPVSVSTVTALSKYATI